MDDVFIEQNNGLNIGNDVFITESNIRNDAVKVKYEPKHAAVGTIPKIKFSEFSGPRIEELEIIDQGNNRAIYFGNSHAQIFPMLDKAITAGILKVPLEGNILNLDYHADIATYSSQTTNYEASWQRRGIDQNYWTKSNSYNCRPTHSTATPLREFSPDDFVNSINFDQTADLVPVVLSIDLDFFNDLQTNSVDFLNYVDPSPIYWTHCVR